MSSLRGHVIYAQSHIRQWSARITQVAAACGCQFDFQIPHKTMLLFHKSGSQFKITMPLPYCVEFNVMRAYLELEYSWKKVLHSLHIAFNIRWIVGSPLHFTLWWKWRGATREEGGSGDKALAGFDLRSAEAGM